MHQKNVDKIANELFRFGQYYADSWAAFRLANGNITVESPFGYYATFYTWEEFVNEFLPAQKNHVKMSVEVTRQHCVTLEIPDDIPECDYVKYAMEHTEEMVNENNGVVLLEEYDKVNAVINIMD